MITDLAYTNESSSSVGYARLHPIFHSHSSRVGITMCNNPYFRDVQCSLPLEFEVLGEDRENVESITVRINGQVRAC
jgi:hypothetical protein